MDGIAIDAGLASSPDREWLRDIVPKVCLRIKVHSALCSLYLQSGK